MPQSMRSFPQTHVILRAVLSRGSMRLSHSKLAITPQRVVFSTECPMRQRIFFDLPRVCRMADFPSRHW